MPTHYPCLLDPTIYPDYTRRPVKVPTWATFENTTQFCTLRSLHQDEWRKDLDRYTQEFRLGRVIWPLIHCLWAPNIGEVVEEIRRRKLYLFDLWSHVPGSGMEGIWSNITPPPGVIGHLERTLGDRFLGIDNGEQDGRYVGGYALQQCPSFASRYEQYLNFQRHFQKMCDDLGNHMSALVSLCFGHYFLKEGNHVLLGAETAQALPSSQVYYAFIRGAGKQYGVHWFGNASVFNRWGWKNYDTIRSEGDGNVEHEYGPMKGTSLNLLKRLIYSHYLYNCVAVGFENGWITRDKEGKHVLSPIGTIQAKAAEFVEAHGQPGTMHTPVAVLLDFFAGWAMPRHLYSGSVYQVWGGMPYDAGDYLTHDILSMLYPGYEDASYYHDERGFLSPTPYGDIADCLLSDAPLWVLRQYGLVVAASALTMTRELKDKLTEYVSAGGQLVITAANARGLVPGLELAPEPIRIPAFSVVHLQDGSSEPEQHSFELYPATLPPGAQTLASCDGQPAVVRVASGSGSFLVLLSTFGLNAEPLVSGKIPNAVDTPLPCPYTLLNHVRRAIGSALAGQQLFSVGDGLSLITCRKGPGHYTLGVHNNALDARPLKITPLCGPIQSINELSLDQGEKGQVGYWPGGFEKNDGGTSDVQTIAGGDVRLFEVKVAEQGVTVLPPAEPPAPPKGRMLALRGARSIQEEILARPTFFQQFDGVKVDWSHLHQRDTAQLDRDRGWLARQKLQIIVDFSHGLNFYPTLTLLNNYPPRYDESAAAMDDMLAKLSRLGGCQAVIELHRAPENNCPPDRVEELMLSGVRSLCRRAAAHGIELCLQHHPLKWCPWGASAKAALEFIDRVNERNLHFALNVGHAALSGESLDEILRSAGDRLGLVLLCAPRRDLFGQSYDAHAPIHGSGLDLSALAACASVPQVLDGVYANADEEYLDCQAAWAR